MMNGDVDPVSLYKKDNKGKIRVWTIFADDYEMSWEHGVLGGNLQEDFECIEEGKAGRSQHEQLVLKINSKINARLKKGYVLDADDAENNPVRNLLGLQKQMLAKTFTYDNPKYQWIIRECEGSDDDANIILQPKLDGHRCSIHNNGKEIIAYSRNGIQTKAITEIIEEVSEWLPSGATVDGELYHHGTSLQQIGSWVKKRQVETGYLNYIIYDQFSDDPYKDRLDEICEWIQDPQPSSRISIVQSVSMWSASISTLPELLDHYIDVLGYEGLMIRVAKFGYQDDKRSESLLKYKRVFDAEFVVVAVYKSDRGVTMLECVLGDGRRFPVTCPGNNKFKEQVMTNKSEYIGKTVNVEYPNLTDDGLLFQPIATAFVERHLD
jgi:DNA ligase-1